MIYRGCRYAVLPMPLKPSTVRNFTMFASPLDVLPALKKQYAENEFVQEFLKVELPEMEAMTEINESFRQKLFADWLTSPAKFKDLNAKFKNFNQKRKVTKVEYVNPSDEDVMKRFEELVVAVPTNQTFTARVLVPEQVRSVLFEGWEGKGIELVRLLPHYGEFTNLKTWKIFATPVCSELFQLEKSKQKKFNLTSLIASNDFNFQ